ncbi:MAG: PAS domain-containing sensor histidine kinase [Acidobacteriota bacterium]
MSAWAEGAKVPMSEKDPNEKTRLTVDTSAKRGPLDAERWLAAIVESSDDAILGKSLDGVITSWNTGATRIFGYEADEAIGKPISLLAWPGEEQMIESFLDKLRRGERVDHFEVARKHKSGRKIIVSLSLSPIEDANGEIIGIAKIARDITERKAAQEAMIESESRMRVLAEQGATARAEALAERRFRQLIENAPDAILQVNPAGAIVIANRTAETMFGYSREELMAAGVDVLVPAAIRGHHAAHRASFAAAGVSRPMGAGLELLATRKDGSTFPVEISLSPVQTEAGVHVTAVIRDVTQRKDTEERVKVLQESYMMELETRHKEAERLNRMKSEFMASVSHELRTPLHTIIGFAELLEEETETLLNEKQKRFLKHIHGDSEHLLGLINDVLDLSRIEAGGLNLHTQVLSLEEIVSEAIKSIRPYAESRSVTLVEGEGLDREVVADPVRLRQILYNLLSNGAKFTQAGGVVRVDATPDEKLVRVTVSDTGLGIAAEECQRIFDKFYQVGFTPVGVREGTGLGLAICRQLVEMQGGTIWAESVVGQGSQFHFTLPRSDM